MLNICLQSCSSMFLHSLRAACFPPHKPMWVPLLQFHRRKERGSIYQPHSAAISAQARGFFFQLSHQHFNSYRWLHHHMAVSALNMGFIQRWMNSGEGAVLTLYRGCSSCQQEEVRQHSYGREVGIIPPSPDLPASQYKPMLLWLNSVKSFKISRWKIMQLHCSWSAWLQRGRILFAEA